MNRLFDQFRLFLGPARLRLLFILVAATGLLSLVLNVVVSQYTWVTLVQSLLLLVAVVGAALIIGSRMEGAERGRWAAILLPAFGAIVLGLTVLPQLWLPLFGGAVGWVIAGSLIFRSRMPMGYRQAVKHLRKGEIEQAIDQMNTVVKENPDDPNHYRFRAELLRLWGKLDRARRDYQKMIELEPTSALAYNGLAEVNLQAGDYPRALDAGQKAAEFAPDDWVAFYNLGMIEDRLRQSDAAIEHLQKALALGVPEARHRLLVYLYLVRAYTRLGDQSAAEGAVAELKRQRGGLEEWQKILEHEEAATLRAVLGEDVQLAGTIANGQVAATALQE